MDGVLADFDARAQALLNTDNTYKFEYVWGTEVFWSRLDEDPHFFFNLPPMPDMPELWAGVRHLNPVVLTALPKTNPLRVEIQKRMWVDKHLGRDVRVICCQTHEKPAYCRPGDIIVDDRATNKPAWEAAGGIYVVHTDAKSSLAQLEPHL